LIVFLILSPFGIVRSPTIRSRDPAMPMLAQVAPLR
jgi:hypothetical protein